MKEEGLLWIKSEICPCLSPNLVKLTVMHPMIRIYSILLLVFLHCTVFAQRQKNPILKLPHETNPNTTATYQETIDWYSGIAAQYPEITLKEYGLSDVGKPIHLAIISRDGDIDPTSIRANGKRILLVNNAIHPGEPCGVDATMQLIRDLMIQKDLKKLLDEVVIVTIPIYNIGGALYRNSHTRANQNGPESYGFRGNIRHLDLNRDFIKCDSRNAFAFTSIFQEWMPDIFIDNHTSNGADYQYTMTMIATQHNKLGGQLGPYLNDQLMPLLYQSMEEAGWEMSPYVYARETPDKGIMGFLDSPRYSSGYTGVFNTIGFIPEAHMLKPYKDRVASTYQFMKEMLILLDSKEGETIKRLTEQQRNAAKTQQQFDIHWTLNKDNVQQVQFKGYEAGYKPSNISGKDRLYYNQSKPYTKAIPFLNDYKADITVDKPSAYIIPQAWHEVIERLEANHVQLERLEQDEQVAVDVYYIKGEETTKSPYEGHYLHYNIQVEKRQETIQFYKGDYRISMNQIRNRYIMETLEPQAHDSFFAWGFFDSILQQKEHFSSYVFEDRALEILESDPTIKQQFEDKKTADDSFAESAGDQLQFIYECSEHYEVTHRRYPVYRVR